MKSLFTALVFSLAAFQARALELDVPFQSIDGGTFSLSQWSGQPILVVNTASRCAFTKQYSGLQKLYDSYRDAGLVVVAIPSNAFRQELATNESVKDFCELQYGIDMPMSGITKIIGPDAHPFFASLKQERGFEPAWNFNKVLIGRTGAVVETYSATTSPMSSRVRRDIESALN